MFCALVAKISGVRLQGHWCSGFRNINLCNIKFHLYNKTNSFYFVMF